MIHLLWVGVAAIAVTTWNYYNRLRRVDDLGSVSARWLQEYRNETHQER